MSAPENYFITCTVNAMLTVQKNDLMIVLLNASLPKKKSWDDLMNVLMSVS